MYMYVIRLNKAMFKLVLPFLLAFKNVTNRKFEITCHLYLLLLCFH